eukprot:403350209
MRMPKNELKHLAKLECPVEVKPSKGKKVSDMDIMIASKRLREHLGVKEETTCAKCQQKNACPFRDQTASQVRPRVINGVVKKEASIRDLQNVLLGVYQRSMLQNQSLKQIEEDVTIENNPENSKQITIQQKPKLNDFDFTTYNSASIILSSLDYIYTDLVENNGLQFKIFMNDMLSEGKKFNLTPDENSTALAKRSENSLQKPDKNNELAEVETLMNQLELTKNRKEKRVLLAKFNQKQELIWGDKQSIKAIQVHGNKSMQRTNDPAVDLNKVYNKHTHSFVDKEVFQEALQRDTRNPNNPDRSQKKLTQTLSTKQRLSSINVYEKTQLFEKKVNVENELKRQQVRELAFARTQFIENNQPAFEAIAEGKRVAAYFESEDQAISFVRELYEQKQQKIESYGFQEIDEKSKLTIGAGQHSVIPGREELSKMLLEGNTKNKMLNQDQSQPNLLADMGIKVLELEGDIHQEVERLERVQVNDANSKDPEQNFFITKAKPIDNTPEKAQANQKKKIIKVTVNDRYIAENYYKTSDMDELLYEKDGTISKMRQFDYKIHRFKPSKPQKEQSQQ